MARWSVWSSPLVGAVIGIAIAASGGLARAQTCHVNTPHVDGQWRTLPYLMPINPISTTLLHDGRVLIVAGSENDANNSGGGVGSYRAAYWDPAGTGPSSVTVFNPGYDVFCSGTAVLPDGRPLIIGGTSDYSFKGDNRATFFDPMTNEMAQAQSMVDGRWYATATALSDGRVMAWSGLNLAGGTNASVEIYSLTAAGTGWTPPIGGAPGPPLFPRMFLLPSGRVFFTGQGGGGGVANSWIFDPVAGTWTASAATTGDRQYGTSVLLPLLAPAYTPKVINFGGGNPATPTTEIIDLSAATPAWTAGPSMSTGRIQGDSILLPNGKILVEGGSVNNESPDAAGKHADLYDPVTGSFASGGTAAYSRLYHTTALLLPDATVAVMGSNPGSRGRYEPAIEIYRPAYLFDGSDRLITSRPSITALSSSVLGYGAALSVSYTGAASIGAAVLMRPGSSNHAFDMEQRLIGLCGAAPQPACAPSGGTLSVTLPASGNLAPPGYYMLFLLDGNGVPSTARFLQILPKPLAPPTGTIAAPAGDVTVNLGGTVSFSSPTAAAKYSWVFPGGTPATSTAQNPGAITFSTAGYYEATLTVIDANGNSDPSPPTRGIQVLPATGDFDIAVSPSSVSVQPGQSAQFTVTVTARSGFSGAVTLSASSEAGLPAGIASAGFSPAAITGSGTATLTMTSTTAATPYALSLTVAGVSGALRHTAATTMLVQLPAPTGLTATGGVTSVALAWPAVAPATSYHVWRAGASGGPYQVIGCPGGTSYTDAAVTNGTTYYYVVTSVFSGGPNVGGESPNSPEASAHPLTVPARPTGLTATPGSGQIALAWTATATATSYHVKRATAKAGTYVTVGSPAAPGYLDVGLTNGQTYWYMVSALNAAGESANSAKVSAKPVASTGPPAAPTGLTAASASAGTADLVWTQSTTPGITANHIFRRQTGSAYPGTPTASIAPGTTFHDTGLPSHVYCYVVTAVGPGGESAFSNESCPVVN